MLRVPESIGSLNGMRRETRPAGPFRPWTVSRWESALGCALLIQAARLAAILLRIARGLRHADKGPARL